MQSPLSSSLEQGWAPVAELPQSPTEQGRTLPELSLWLAIAMVRHWDRKVIKDPGEPHTNHEPQ